MIEDAAERALRGIEPKREPGPIEGKVSEARNRRAAGVFLPALAQVNEQGSAVRRVARLSTFDDEGSKLLGDFAKWRRGDRWRPDRSSARSDVSRMGPLCCLADTGESAAPDTARRRNRRDDLGTPRAAEAPILVTAASGSRMCARWTAYRSTKSSSTATRRREPISMRVTRRGGYAWFLRVQEYKDQDLVARQTWAERGKDHPDLYAPLSPERDRQQEPAREPPAQAPEPGQERTLTQERAAMKRLDLPEYAAEKHGYEIEWGDDEHTRATLLKDNDELRATKSKDGAWSYVSQTSAERGDILDFEIHRGARTLANAREEVRPELERVEKEHGRLDPQPELERGPERGGRLQGDDDAPELDPTRRRGRGR